ncbi:MAG TPA: hypothetical protein VJV05_17795 [Pyrinomonadaceae bacterium]|nr:hypothetical protein [Pyrinomonadaceae bacterium]
MDETKIGVIGKLLAVFQILVAIVYFDWNSWNQIAASVLLLVGALLLLGTGTTSSFFRKLLRVISYLAVLLSLVLVIKVLFFD